MTYGSAAAPSVPDTDTTPVQGEVVYTDLQTTPTSWADIKPKVSAAGLAYGGCLAVAAVLGDVGVDVSGETSQAISGFVMLLAAYLWPER